MKPIIAIQAATALPTNGALATKPAPYWRTFPTIDLESSFLS